MWNDIKVLFSLMRFFLKGKFWPLFIGFLAAVIFSLLGLLTPYLTKFLIDTVFNQHRPDLLLPLLIVCAMAIIVISITGLGSDYMVINALENSKIKMRHQLFDRLLKAPANFISGNGSGEISYRLFNDSETVNSFFNTILISIPINFLFTLIIGGIMIKWNTRMAAFVFIVLILQIVVIMGFRKPLLRFAFMQKGTAQWLSGKVVERFRNVELIMAANMDESENIRLVEGLQQLKSINVKSFILGRISQVSVLVISNIWSFGILWYGGRLVLLDQISLGTLMAFLLISGMLYPHIEALTKAVLAFQDVRASLNRFLEYYNTPPAIVEALDAKELKITSGEIVFNNVVFGYNSDVPVLKNFSATIAPKSITSIVGRSGIGKSTVVRLIARIYDPWKGTIYIDGQDIKQVTLHSLRQKTGYSIQNNYIIGGTIRENICYGSGDVDEERIMQAAKKAGAHDFIMKCPAGLDTPVGEGGLQLSGGEGQRIALAREFINKHDIVILDEPTSFIDPENESIIINAIQDLKQTSTEIVIAHRLSTAKIADKIILIDDGRIAEEGKHETLLAQNGLYAALYKEYSDEESSISVV